MVSSVTYLVVNFSIHSPVVCSTRLEIFCKVIHIVIVVVVFAWCSGDFYVASETFAFFVPKYTWWVAATWQHPYRSKKEIAEQIHIRRQRPTLNIDGGYELPANINYLQSRNQLWWQLSVHWSKNVRNIYTVEIYNAKKPLLALLNSSPFTHWNDRVPYPVIVKSIPFYTLSLKKVPLSGGASPYWITFITRRFSWAFRF